MQNQAVGKKGGPSGINLENYVDKTVEKIIKNFHEKIGEYTISSDGEEELALLKKKHPFPLVMEKVYQKIKDNNPDLEIKKEIIRGGGSGFSAMATIQCKFILKKNAE